MFYRLKPVNRLINELSKLPGVGHRTASRFAANLLSRPTDDVSSIVSALEEAKKLTRCPLCRCFTDGELCLVCDSNDRNTSIVCVVETPFDVDKVEETGTYNGLYFVLDALLSPLDGVNPSDLPINLLERLAEKYNVKEIVVATPFTLEGDATAHLISSHFSPADIKVSRPTMGMPSGRDIEFIDSFTMGSALQNRTPL